MKRFVAIALLLFGSFSLFAQQWEINIELNDILGILQDGCTNEKNEVICVGYYEAYAFAVIIAEDGTYTSKTYMEEGKTSEFTSILMLDNDHYLVTGLLSNVGSSENFFWIAIIDSNLNILHSTYKEQRDGFGNFGGGKACVDTDGTIIVSAFELKVENELNRRVGVLMRVTPGGDIINCQYLYREYPDPLFYFHSFLVRDLMMVPSTGEMMVLGCGSGGILSITFFNYDFEYCRSYLLKDQQDNHLFEKAANSDCCLDENTFLLVGCQQDDSGNNKPHLLYGKTNFQGSIFQKTEINRQDTLNYCASFQSMATADDSTIFLMSNCRIGHWAAPANSEIYLANTDLEILGSKHFFDESGSFPSFIVATKDQGCISVSIENKRVIRVKKFLREDFNPIPCSVKNVSKEQIKATVFPNPAGDEIHFDISELPAGKEHRISISDAMGRTVMSRIIRGEGNVLTLGVSSLPSGIYTYRIYNAENEIVSGKFVKE